MHPVERFFHPVLSARKLKQKPVKVQVAGRSYVLFRDAEGRAGALLDVCPHRLAPLSAGRVREDGRLACPYHGWHFDIEGHGVAPSAPGLKRCDATALQVVERNGYLWIAGRSVPTSAFPEVRWDGFSLAGAFSILFRAPIHVALDNFSETEHTPWVHTRLGWSETDAGAIEFSAETFPDRSEVAYAARQRDTLMQHLIGSRKGDLFSNRYTCRFDPVRMRFDLTWLEAKTRKTRGAIHRTQIFLVPETERTTRFHVFVHLHFERRFLRMFTPALKPISVALAYREILDDARFIPIVADTPEEITGMRLSKFDKPVVHNRQLLRRIYWNRQEESTQSTPGGRGLEVADDAG